MLPEVVRRSGIEPAAIDDIIFAESHYGGSDLARYAAAACGMEAPRPVRQPALRETLTAIGNAAARVWSGEVTVDDAGDEVAMCRDPKLDV